MKNQNLENLTFDSLVDLAKGLKITLSYKGEDGKRKRHNKAQLIELIAAAGEGVPAHIVEEVEVDMKSTIAAVKNENSKIEIQQMVVAPMEEAAATNVDDLSPMKVMQYAKQAIQNGDVTSAKEALASLESKIKAEKKNMFQIKQWSHAATLIKSLMKMKRMAV